MADDLAWLRQISVPQRNEAHGYESWRAPYCSVDDGPWAKRGLPIPIYTQIYRKSDAEKQHG